VAQLHLYLSEELAEKVRQRAAAGGQSVSAFLAELVRGQIADTWPEGYFENVVGGWVGEPLRRPEQRDADTREDIDVPVRHQRVHPGSE
jgi:hypothetical protein